MVFTDRIQDTAFLVNVSDTSTRSSHRWLRSPMMDGSGWTDEIEVMRFERLDCFLFLILLIMNVFILYYVIGCCICFQPFENVLEDC